MSEFERRLSSELKTFAASVEIGAGVGDRIADKVRRRKRARLLAVSAAPVSVVALVAALAFALPPHPSNPPTSPAGTGNSAKANRAFALVPPAPPESLHPLAAGPEQCGPSQLRLSVVGPGQTHVVHVAVQNVSAVPCSLARYPTFRLFSGSRLTGTAGTTTPDSATTGFQPSARVVTLAPRARAFTALSWAPAAGSRCVLVAKAALSPSDAVVALDPPISVCGTSAVTAAPITETPPKG